MREGEKNNQLLWRIKKYIEDVAAESANHINSIVTYKETHSR
jgi:hypothetical protein